MFDRAEPAPCNDFRTDLALLICGNFEQLLARPLIQANKHDIGRHLYEAPFAVLAHDNCIDPIFIYANLQAQKVFEMNWEQFVKLPSRMSAEPMSQAQRASLLALVASKGFIDHYSGIRISKTGKRFEINQATVWNLCNAKNERIGQAATFEQVIPITP